MLDLLGIYFWLIIAQALIFGFSTSYIAGQKNRDKLTWFFIGFFLGFIGLIVIAASRVQENQGYNNSVSNFSKPNTMESLKSIFSTIRYVDLDSPVEVISVEIRVDKSTGIPYLFVLFKNLEYKILNAIKFTAICYNSFGEPVSNLNGNEIDLIMQDLDISPKSTFGKNINYSLKGLEQTRIVDIRIEEISFANGDRWKRLGPLKDISNYEYDGDESLIEIAGIDAIVYPFEDGDSWRCVCGKFNKHNSNKCLNCGRKKIKVLEEYNKDKVAKKIKKNQEIARIKNKKLKKTSIIVILLIVLTSSLLMGVKYYKHLSEKKEVEAQKIITGELTDGFIKKVREKDCMGVEKLINEGLKINLIDKNKQSPLLIAAENADEDMIKLLIENGADVDVRNMQDETAMVIAVKNARNLELDKINNVVKILLENGADADIQDFKEETVLHLAVANIGKQEIVKMLLEENVNVNLKNEWDRTALHEAIKNSFDSYHEEIIKLLLDNGADVKTKDYEGRTVLIDAVPRQDIEIIKLIISKGADINAKSNNGLTALNSSIDRGDYKIIELLLENGADINQKGKIDSYYKTIEEYSPLELLERSFLDETAKRNLKRMLIRFGAN